MSLTKSNIARIQLHPAGVEFGRQRPIATDGLFRRVAIPGEIYSLCSVHGQLVGTRIRGRRRTGGATAHTSSSGRFSFTGSIISRHSAGPGICTGASTASGRIAGVVNLRLRAFAGVLVEPGAGQGIGEQGLLEQAQAAPKLPATTKTLAQISSRTDPIR
jgi:hypothetical protein